MTSIDLRKLVNTRSEYLQHPVWMAPSQIMRHPPWIKVKSAWHPLIIHGIKSTLINMNCETLRNIGYSHFSQYSGLAKYLATKFPKVEKLIKFPNFLSNPSIIENKQFNFPNCYVGLHYFAQLAISAIHLCLFLQYANYDVYPTSAKVFQNSQKMQKI